MVHPCIGISICLSSDPIKCLFSPCLAHKVEEHHKVVMWPQMVGIVTVWSPAILETTQKPVPLLKDEYKYNYAEFHIVGNFSFNQSPLN